MTTEGSKNDVTRIRYKKVELCEFYDYDSMLFFCKWVWSLRSWRLWMSRYEDYYKVVIRLIKGQVLFWLRCDHNQKCEDLLKNDEYMKSWEDASILLMLPFSRGPDCINLLKGIV